MGRVLRFGCGAVILAVIIVAVLVAIGSNQSGGVLAMEYLGPGQRWGDYSEFNVRFRNGTAEDATNPQTRVVVELGGQEWSCQGYVDPIAGEPISGVTDVVSRPLITPPGEEVPVTVLCRMPNVRFHTAEVRLR